MLPETWCVISDMGEFDAIFEESIDRKVCELFIEINQQYVKTPFQIKLKKDVRKYTKFPELDRI